ncbi:MAG TPA: hypothetical protein VKA21_16065 [Candidatus Binatia bacterium]|nr:hypothetical protein [Candidatus Binatia bacterium]
MPIVVLDPTVGAAPADTRLAPPLASLAGTRIGLLDNGKVNVDRFLDHVEHALRTRHGVADVLRRRKPNMSAPAPAATIAELAVCDAVVSAVGD